MATNQQVSAASANGAEGHGPGNRLGSFLCWAVVLADIGTSVYYVPGILYGHYGALAGLFVILTVSVFILLTLKYAEVTERFPEGGGVVTVASSAMNPWMGALGGMLILGSYFLTASISSLSGITYFAVIAPAIQPVMLWLTVGVLILLGLLNWWGIKESAMVSAIIAVVAFVSDVIVLVMIFRAVPLAQIGHIFGEMFSTRQLTIATFIAGFAGAFLAFSGLESISQLSPVMRVPRGRVAGWALAIVVVTVGLTSPLLTVFSTTLLCAHGVMDKGLLTCVSATGQTLDPNQFISLLGGQYGGAWLQVTVAVSASALLIFASNTAIIGSYHVFLALTRMQFFPKPLIALNRWRGTPHWAIILSTAFPILVLIGASGQIDLLGDLYAFGLLGAFTLTCLGMDIVRWRERHGTVRYGPTPAQEEAELRAQEAADAHRSPGALATWYRSLDITGRTRPVVAPLARGERRLAAGIGSWPFWAALRRLYARYSWQINFSLGVLTTVLVAFAWSVNLLGKQLATVFGGGVTLLGLSIAFVYQTTKALPTVFPKPAYGAMPNAWLVVLPVGSDEKLAERREALVRAAARGAGTRPLVFLYVQPHRDTFTPALFEIDDPYGRDQDAQHAFSRAAVIADREGVPYRGQRFIYRVGGDNQLVDVWRMLRPEETAALAGSGLGRLIRADYVRQDDEGAGIKFYGHRGGANAPAEETGRGSRAEEGPSVAVVGLPARLHRLISRWFRGLWANLARLGASRAQAPEEEAPPIPEENAPAAEDPGEVAARAIPDETDLPEPERRIHKPGLPRGSTARHTPPLAPGDSTARGVVESDQKAGAAAPPATGEQDRGGPADSPPSRRTRQPSRPLR